MEKNKTWILTDFGERYCEAVEDDDTKEVDKRKKYFDNYKSVLNSKSNEESLANFAKCEPGHGQFRFQHPWKHYLAVGELIRQCAYRIDALNSSLNADIQVSSDIKKILEKPLRRISSESGKAMKEMSISLKKMTKPSSSDIHVQNAQSACKSLTNLLNSGILKEVDPLELISLLTAISLLIDIKNLTEKILESLHELASAARFKKKTEPPVFAEKLNAKNIAPAKCHDHHVVTIIGDYDNSISDNPLNEVTIHESMEMVRDIHLNCVSCGQTILRDIVM